MLLLPQEKICICHHYTTSDDEKKEEDQRCQGNRIKRHIEANRANKRSEKLDEREPIAAATMSVKVITDQRCKKGIADQRLICPGNQPMFN